MKQSSARGDRPLQKNSHIEVFSLKTSETFEISFHPEMHHNVFPVLPPPQLSEQWPPQLSEQWLQGTPRPEKMVGGGQWRRSNAQEKHPQNPSAAAKVNIHQGIRYQSFQYLAPQTQ